MVKMMVFEKHKLDCLKKIDKSKQQSIDKGILSLVNKINSIDNYYTTSSCAGRAVLLVRKSDKKQEIEWLFKTHDNVSLKEIKRALVKLPKEDVWFRYEGAILHVACKTIEDAQRLVNSSRDSGFKRSGIQSTNRKIVVEIINPDYIDTIVAKDGESLVDEGYLNVLVKEANKKSERNKEKLKKFILSLADF